MPVFTIPSLITPIPPTTRFGRPPLPSTIRQRDSPDPSNHVISRLMTLIEGRHQWPNLDRFSASATDPRKQPKRRNSENYIHWLLPPSPILPSVRFPAKTSAYAQPADMGNWWPSCLPTGPSCEWKSKSRRRCRTDARIPPSLIQKQETFPGRRRGQPDWRLGRLAILLYPRVIRGREVGTPGHLGIGPCLLVLNCDCNEIFVRYISWF